MKIGRVTDDTLALFARVWREQISSYLPQMLMILGLVVVIAVTTSFYPLLIKAAFDAFADPLTAESTGFVRRMERLVEGEPVLVARDGKLLESVLRRELLTRADFDAALRQQGCRSIDEVELALLETNGHITIVPRQPS